MRKTKIICTIGPASESESVLTQMCKAGMNVARLNFSHGSHEEHQKKIDTIKKVRKALGLPIAIMLDTKGPEYRIKTFENGKITLKDGDTFTLTTDDIVGNQERVSVTYKNLINNLKVGDHVLINNGLIILEVEKLKAPDAICKVLVGGEVSDKKSMNFPNKVMDHAFLSEQDKKDLLFGIKNDVDFVAASFVSVKKDVEDMRKFLDENGGEDIDIIAKIENRSGVEHIEEICEIANGVMIARVDLGGRRIIKKKSKLAKLDRLQLDETMHRSNLNLHLFKYIKYCGLSPLEYIKEYLSNLQPYMIERRKDQEKQESFICVVDNMYRISVYIKADNSFGDEMIISFHEDNIRGVAKTNSLIKNTKDRLVPVIADSYGSINRENGNVSVKLFVQRGMKTLPIDVIGFKCKDVFIVREGDIDRQFLDYCNQYIRDLYTSNLKLDFDQVEVFSMLQQISFTSYGRDTFSSLSLLIDSIAIQQDSISKQTADFALVTFAQSLKLTENQKKELIELLNEKYMVSDIKSIDDILYRIKSAMYATNEDANYFKELDTLDSPQSMKLD